VRALATTLFLSAIAWGQAEPAPESYRPPKTPGMPQPQQAQQRRADSQLPKWHIAVAPHMNVLYSDIGIPRVGFGAGVQVTRALVPIGPARFGVGADFAYDRFQHDVKTSMFTSDTEFVAHATFAGLLVVDAIVRRLRPWLALGGGFSVANFERPSLMASQAVSRVGVAGLVKLAVGLGVRVYEGFELGLRSDFVITISGENVDGKDVWQPGYYSLGLDLGFRF
jgi:hypothetical protein